MARTHELVIASLPNRSGLYLCTQEGSTIRPLARFSRGEESAREFVAWCVKAGINYEDTRGKTWQESGGPATGVERSTGSSG